MIVTLQAAQMYIERVNPKASLHQAWAALQPCERVANYLRHQSGRCQFLARDARAVCVGGRVVQAWNRDTIVSGGPIRG